MVQFISHVQQARGLGTYQPQRRMRPPARHDLGDAVATGVGWREDKIPRVDRELVTAKGEGERVVDRAGDRPCLIVQLGTVEEGVNLRRVLLRVSLAS